MRRILAATLVCALTGPGLAHADVITQTVTAPAAEADWNTTQGASTSANQTSNGSFSFDPFDTSLGTLTSVTLTRNVTLSFSGSLTNTLGETETFTFTVTNGIGIPTAPAGTFGGNQFQANPYLNSSMTLDAGQTAALDGSTTPNSNTFTIATDNLPNFENGPVTFSVQTFLAASVYQGSNALDGIQQTLATTAGGTYELDYTYTPDTALPEPGSLMAMVVGLAGLIAARRRPDTL